jgi:hypothetical protein
MNTQLLRYLVLNEHLTFPLIPRPVGRFRANGSHTSGCSRPRWRACKRRRNTL